MLSLSAPAKLNLYLHVMGKRSDGYHLLDSMVVFLPDICDRLTFEHAHRLEFQAAGILPEGAGGENNLVVKAARALAAHAGREPNARIRLEKNIPAGAGLGGGSADAAAAVRGLERLWSLSLADEDRDRILLTLGADVPVCYHNRPCRFEGIGENISDIPAVPSLPLLLIWPNAHTATKDVFTTRPAYYREQRVNIPSSFSDIHDFISFLRTTGNDLQETAEALSPSIRTARGEIEGQDGCLLARMSGSGSCVFGLFENREQCEAAEKTLRLKYPGWWVRAALGL